MTVKIMLTPKLLAQIGRGNTDVLKLINRQVADELGGNPTAWRWQPWLDETYGYVMLLKASR